jgi:acetyl esterase/lipase
VKLRDDGRPLPAAAVAMSPWTDLALTGASMRANAGADPMLVAADVPRYAAAYLGGADARDPYASPLYADPRGLPPTLMQAGSDEILRDDAVRMAERMRAAGCAVELQIWPKMVHTWQLLTPVLPEARAALADIARFLDSRLG